MKLRSALDRIGAIAAKEFIHIRRDPRMIVAILILPLIQLVLFAYAIGFDVRHIPTVVLDQDNSAASRAYLETYETSGFFDIRGAVDSMADVDAAFKGDHARAAVIVGPGFEQAQESGGKGAVQVLLDGSEPTSAQLGLAYATALNASANQQATLAFAQSNGADLSAVGQLEPRVRTWYNPEGSSTAYLVPGLLVVIVMIVTVQQTAVTLVRERDQGTLQQMIVSPLRQSELMLGKMLPWVLLGLIDTVAIVLAAVLVFSVPLRGDLMLLAVSMMLFILCSLGIGLMISARANSAESANMVGLLISFLPAFLFSGFAFPLGAVPPFLRALSYVFPGRYMMAISRGVFLKGAGWAEMWPQVVALALYAVATIVIASALERRRAS